MEDKTEKFIQRAIKIHGNKYDYSKVSYVNSVSKVEFYCKKHEISVFMLPGNHLAGKGCNICARESMRLKFVKSKEDFISEANAVHEGKYTYDSVNYINARIKVEIYCPIHKEFFQTPDSHLSGKGCQKCRNDKVGALNALTKEEFVQKANLKHNFKYDYSLVEYKNENSLVTIICPIHGEFEQKGANHLKSRGCQTCGNIGTSNYQKENPNGWSVDTWKEKAKKSKLFDSFKLYIIECFGDGERFFKIGRTFTTTKNRFLNHSRIPYEFIVLKEVIGSAEEIVKLELKLKKEHKNYKYRPKLEFGGQFECFNYINLEDAENI